MCGATTCDNERTCENTRQVVAHDRRTCSTKKPSSSWCLFSSSLLLGPLLSSSLFFLCAEGEHCRWTRAWRRIFSSGRTFSLRLVVVYIFEVAMTFSFCSNVWTLVESLVLSTAPTAGHYTLVQECVRNGSHGREVKRRRGIRWSREAEGKGKPRASNRDFRRRD